MHLKLLLALVLLGCSSTNTTPPPASVEGETPAAADVVSAAPSEGDEARSDDEPSPIDEVDAPEEAEPEEAPPSAADEEPPRSGLPDGAACTTNESCASGTCEGEGCGDDTPGTCMPSERMCLRDLRPFCGCDGKTFMRGSNCPGQRFASRGPCDGDPPFPQLPPR